MFGSTLWLTLATLAGLVAGFAREWLLVAAWGAGSRSDGFLVAVFLPEALRMTLAAGLLAAAALPLYQQRDGQRQQAWLASLSPRLLGVGLGLFALLALGAPLWVRLIGPGLDAAAHDQAAANLRWLAACAPGLVMHGLFSIPLQARQRFVLPGLGSLLFNLPPVLYLFIQGTASDSQELALCFFAGSVLMCLPLLAPEQARYREVGRLAAAAASEALRAARPAWSEQDLAGACARALWSRGLHAVYVLAAGAERFGRYRRAPPAASPLGERAVLALCAQAYGLCASLSRQRRFRPAREGIDEADAAILALEAVALDACVAGHALSMVYHALDSAYAYAGQPDTVQEFRQGGIAGYRAPEVAAGAHTEITLKDGMALAFHPSLPGSMVEDTFLLSGGRLHNLTCDPDWPATSVEGRLRPLTLELP